MKADYSRVNCFDMEMCCWNDDENRDVGEIISIGIVELCLLTGKTLREAHYYVKPDLDQVSQFCTDLTGITQSMVNKQGRPLGKVLDIIRKNFGSKRTYVAWGCDPEYLATECGHKGLESPIATSLNAALLYMTKMRHNGGRVSMRRAMEASGLEFEGQQHNALVDAKNLSKLIVTKSLL